MSSSQAPPSDDQLPAVVPPGPVAPAIVEGGPLWSLDERRERLLDEVSLRTIQELSGGSLDFLLSEALYSEKFRLRRDKGNIFTRHRRVRDRKMLSRLQKGLVKGPAEGDRRLLLDSVTRHYAEEIGGQFNPEVYRFATNAVPLGFNWLVNAASVRQFLPWKQTEILTSRLNIYGEVEQLRNLSKKGTILLVPTHQSNLDSLLVGYLIYLMGLPPFSYGAGLNLYSNPVLSYFMSRLGAYTVDRKKTSAIYKATLKNYSTVILREGIHSIFFPGAGRSRSGAIESKIKLGLLGTGLDAQIEGLKSGKPNPNVYVVPMVVSYHFVLEAASLIEDYLVESGRHRLIITDDESWQYAKVLQFFWKAFSSQSSFTARIGRPMDIFGNFVDEEGRSLGPNGTTIDPVKLLTTRGELRSEPQRDREYTRELGLRLSERFHRENTVLTSHLVAFTLFETLRKKYPDLDLYRFLRLSLPQRSITEEEFMTAAEAYHAEVKELADRGYVYLAPELQTSDTKAWVKDGLSQVGLYHEVSVIRRRDGAVWTEDMNLLYYYRNRMSGYGISLLALHGGARRTFGDLDPKGFLA